MRGIKYAIEWVAINDEPTDMDEETISEQLTVQLIADLFDKHPITIAERIIEWRERNDV